MSGLKKSVEKPTLSLAEFSSAIAISIPLYHLLKYANFNLAYQNELGRFFAFLP